MTERDDDFAENPAPTRSNALGDAEPAPAEPVSLPAAAPHTEPTAALGDLLGLHLGNVAIGREVVAGILAAAAGATVGPLADLAARLTHLEDRAAAEPVAPPVAPAVYADTGDRTLGALAADFRDNAALRRRHPRGRGRDVRARFTVGEAELLADALERADFLIGAALESRAQLRQLVREAVDIVEGGGEVDARDWHTTALAALAELD